ncbi:MAG: hypothetical protein V3W34_14065 [Phycisphaerae bacterium]
MKVQPVGSGSLLAARQLYLYYTPRILRFGVAQSLLAERLRHHIGNLYCPRSTCQRRTGPHVTPSPPDKPDQPKTVDRDWPSDLAVEKRPKPVEEIIPVRIESIVGNVFDIWS